LYFAKSGSGFLPTVSNMKEPVYILGCWPVCCSSAFRNFFAWLRVIDDPCVLASKSSAKSVVPSGAADLMNCFT